MVLDPDDPHTPNATDSPGKLRAEEILESRGTGPRTYRNSAWCSWRAGQAAAGGTAGRGRGSSSRGRARRRRTTSTCSRRRPPRPRRGRRPRERRCSCDCTRPGASCSRPSRSAASTAPRLPHGSGASCACRAAGAEGLGVRASKKLRGGPPGDRPRGRQHHLDRVPPWRGDAVPVKTLAEDFAKYLYLRARRARRCCSTRSARPGQHGVETETYAWPSVMTPRPGATRACALEPGRPR